MKSLLSVLLFLGLANAQDQQYSVVSMYSAADGGCGGEPYLTMGTPNSMAQPCFATPCISQGDSFFSVTCTTGPTIPSDGNLLVVQQFANSACTGRPSAWLTLVQELCFADSSLQQSFQGTCAPADTAFLLTACSAFQPSCSGAGCLTTDFESDGLCHPMGGSSDAYYVASSPCNVPNGPCRCVGAQCACCDSYQIPRLLTVNSCTNLTLIDSNTIMVNFGINGYNLYSNTISLSNPTKCFTAPVIPGMSACLNFYSITTTGGEVEGCANVVYTFFGKKYEYTIGCFNLVPKPVGAVNTPTRGNAFVAMTKFVQGELLASIAAKLEQ